MTFESSGCKETDLWWPISLIRNNHYESEYKFEIEFEIEFEVKLEVKSEFKIEL